MNEKLQYRAMLGIPENSCNIVIKPTKKKKNKSKKTCLDEVKTELIKKVNEETDSVVTTPVLDDALHENNVALPTDNTEITETENMALDETENVETDLPTPEEEVTASVKVMTKKKRFKFTALKIQVFIIGALIALILATNAVNPNSGINVFLRTAFGNNPSYVDEREYTEFTPVFSVAPSSSTADDSGALTYSHAGSIYATLSGEVSKITLLENGKYEVTLKHSQNFTSTVSGLDFVYQQVGETVTKNLPIGYAKEMGVKACFYNATGEVITNYTLDGNSVLWVV